MRATIKGLSFDEWPRDFDQSFVITPGGLTGWFTGATMRRDETARPSAHGAFDAPGYLPARVPGIAGTVLASSEDVLERMILQLTGLLADGSTGRLTVQDDHGNATWADVRLASCEVDRHPSGMEADYQIQFWAPDPIRYGEVRSYSPGQVFHRGNIPAVPVIEVAGPVTAPYTVSSQGKSVTVTQSLSSGQTHRIDMTTGWVYRNGALQAGVVSSMNVFTIPPGQLVTVSGPSSATIRVTDSYM